MSKVIGLYRCKICKKDYASYQSLWIHNKKFHINKENESKCMVNESKCMVNESKRMVNESKRMVNESKCMVTGDKLNKNQCK